MSRQGTVLLRPRKRRSAVLDAGMVCIARVAQPHLVPTLHGCTANPGVQLAPGERRESKTPHS